MGLGDLATTRVIHLIYLMIQDFLPERLIHEEGLPGGFNRALWR